MSTPATDETAGRRIAPFGRRVCPVVANRVVGAYRVIEVADADGPAPQAGQFYMLATVDRWGAGDDERPYVPRAFSVMRAREGRLEFMLEDVGPGTARLAAVREGEGMWVTGPLGAGFAPPGRGRRALLVGGGVGVAPLAIWQDELLAAGAAQRSLLGFRSAAHAVGASLLEGAEVATDDGSVCHHGFVTDLLVAALDEADDWTVYACGPPPMLFAVQELSAARAVPAQLALEAPMACGFGACYGCVVETVDGYKRVCVDGPVFDGTELATGTLWLTRASQFAGGHA